MLGEPMRIGMIILYFIVYIQCCVGSTGVDDIVVLMVRRVLGYVSLTPARLLRLWRLLKLNILSAK